ncbi:MAG: hypothetical protein JW894_05895 [Bacteroidales bacterium]|nr:hypothetical protein [Bacteroidales bacterium]
MNCFLQDKNGFIWIGTRDGLNRFDGYEFKIYRYNSDDPNSISNNVIESIFEDKFGYLWIGTDKGLNILNTDNENLIRFIHDPENTNSLSYDEVRDIVQYNDSVYWIATYGGGIDKLTISFEPDLKYNFIHFNEDNKDKYFISTNKVNDLFIDSDRILWVGLERDGILIFSEEDQQFYTPSYACLRTDRNIRATVNMITEDKDKNIWFGTWEHGFFKINKELEITSNCDFKRKDEYIYYNRIVRCLKEDFNNNIWTGSFGGGLVKFNRDSEKIIQYLNDPLRSTSLGHNIIWNLAIDQSGTLWLGTWGAGINLIDLKRTQFIHYKHDPNNPNSLGGNTVNHIFIDYTGKIWISTFEAGISIFDPQTEKFEHIKHERNNQNSLSTNVTWCTYIDPDDNGEIVWIATDVGLNKYNTKTKTFKNYVYQQMYPNDPKNPSMVNIKFIYEDSYDTLWLGTYIGGVNKFDRNKEIFTHYKHDPKDISSISNDAIMLIYEDSYRNLWFGSTNTGLDLYMRDEQKFKHYQFDKEDTTSISSNNILCVFEDSQKNLWVGTLDGLNLFIRGKDNFTSYTVKDGLPNNTISSIEEDDFNNLWISTNAGISKYNPFKKEIKNYDRYDGLENTYSFNASAKTKDGYMLFGGSNGFDFFHPDQIIESQYTAPVIITNFKVFNRVIEINKEYYGRVLLTKAIGKTDKIILSHKHKEFSFDFASLHYPAPEKNLYKYKLEGFNDDWVYTNSSRRFAIYSNMEPGKYVFKVKGTNNDGIWNENEASIEIVILPPFWKTWFFKISVVLMVFGITMLIYWYRINTVKKQKVILENEVKARTKEISEKNKLLNEQTKELNETNTRLEEGQQQIEEHAEELRVINEQLAELNAMKDKFFSIIAHDLKNPMSAILGFSELLNLKFDKIADDKKLNYISKIFESANKTYELLQNLLNWARSQSGRVEFNPENIPLNALIMSNITLIKELARKKNIEIINEINSEEQVYVDENMIDTVIRNLITNALKFTPSGGQVKIGKNLSSDSKFGVYYVKDTGVGIPKDKIPNLFRIDKSTSTEGTEGETGTGLGLILCKEFIEKHRGKIWVESKVNEGTTFYFTLPLKG